MAQSVGPILGNMIPSSAAAGAATFQIEVSGSNFQNGAYVDWQGTHLITAFVSSTQLTASVPAGLVSAPGSYFVFVVNPDASQSAFVTFTVLPGLLIGNSSLPQGVVGQSYSAVLSVTGGTPPYNWSSSGSLPPGLSVAANGAITGIPTQSGVYGFTIQVSDSTAASVSQVVSLTVTGPAVTIGSLSLPNGIATQPYPQQQFTATGGTSPYQWVAQGLPSGITVSAAGVLSGTPTGAGSFTVLVRVTDSLGVTATRSFALTITAAPLSISTVSPLFNGTVGVPYAQTFSAVGGVPPYTWSLISGAVSGLAFNAGGTLQGTPQSAGIFSLTIRATDTTNQAVTQTYSLTVNPPSLTITTGSPLPNAAAGVAYSQRFAVVGGTSPYTWVVASGSSLPGGLSLDPAQGILSGTPSAPGAFNFSLQVTDALGVTGTRSFVLTVTAGSLGITTGNQLPDAMLGAPFSFQMTATGGTPPYTWAANGLPSGLTINAASGLISGTIGSAGPIGFTVTVRDSALVAVSGLFTINVTPPPLPAITVMGLPDAAQPLQQYTVQVMLAASYPVDVLGTAILTSAPADNGPSDGSILFAGGGRSTNFTIPAGANSAAPLQVQTGTVAGTIIFTITRLTVGGFDVTPAVLPMMTTQIAPAAPVISSSTVTRSGNVLTIGVAGYSTPREVTQAVFSFSAGAGQALQASQFTISVDSLFSSWYQDASHSPYGSQFVFTQPFTIQGDVNAVLPQTVTLTNRSGSTTTSVAP